MNIINIAEQFGSIDSTSFINGQGNRESVWFVRFNNEQLTHFVNEIIKQNTIETTPISETTTTIKTNDSEKSSNG